ncbi:MAG: hypothetical protein M1831_007072 [Alyxoria varia]|nr:MAG: hypothetical protein M1831_007072 [Alyxoria varia]
MPTKDGSPPTSPRRSDQGTPIPLPRVRDIEGSAGRRPLSEVSLPFRRSTNASVSALFAPNSLGKRASSPVVGLPRPAIASESPSTTTSNRYQGLQETNEYRSLLVRSLSPNIAVLPSPDAEELLAQKGLTGGLLQLLRPFGDNVEGRVTIRDSAGSSKSCEDYAVHFTRLKDGMKPPRTSISEQQEQPRLQNINGYLDQTFPHTSARLRTGGDIDQIEEVIEKHLTYYDLDSHHTDDSGGEEDDKNRSPFRSPFHLHYFRRLLSGSVLSPHETFSHPVACIVAVSSRNEDPIEELRQLYASTRTGDERLPQWVNGEYLRYYVLIHDEEHDDSQRSMTIFEQMKRHFGLHCHLLRLRSTQCVPSDDDCVQLPVCEWLSAAEELSEIERREKEDLDPDSGPCIYETDAAAVNTMVREMVTQSVIPTMERLCTTWNDQIASRRRGISGRFLSFSKKWTTFGSSSRNLPSTFGGTNTTNSNSNYDSLQGFYSAETAEAIMRKLADYAFMLRDFKLAQSTYDILRNDYSNDKAWKYYAGANEMTVISSLMLGQSASSSASALPFSITRSSSASSKNTDSLDQMLETAVYSYITRTGSLFAALRALAVALELLNGPRESSESDGAARWAYRILDLELVGSVGSALFSERSAAFYSTRKGTGAQAWTSRRRKTAMWSVLAAQAWMNLYSSREQAAAKGENLADLDSAEPAAMSESNEDNLDPETRARKSKQLAAATQAKRCLVTALQHYDNTTGDGTDLRFEDMRAYLHDLQLSITEATGSPFMTEYELDPNVSDDANKTIASLDDQADLVEAKDAVPPIPPPSAPTTAAPPQVEEDISPPTKQLSHQSSIGPGMGARSPSVNSATSTGRPPLEQGFTIAPPTPAAEKLDASSDRFGAAQARERRRRKSSLMGATGPPAVITPYTSATAVAASQKLAAEGGETEAIDPLMNMKLNKEEKLDIKKHRRGQSLIGISTVPESEHNRGSSGQ